MSEMARGLILHSPQGVPYRFDPGALCLELVPTGGPGEWARYEVLHHPADLAVWAARSRLRPAPEIDVTPDEVVEAKRLRDALLRMATHQAHGQPLEAADLDVVNELALAPPLVPRLVGASDRRWARPATGRQLLSTVARDAIELFSGPYAHRIRQCATDNCYLLFVDTSRPGRRRWCSMQRCGNVHKVKALRARQATPDDRPAEPGAAAHPDEPRAQGPSAREAPPEPQPTTQAHRQRAATPAASAASRHTAEAEQPPADAQQSRGLTRDAGWEVGVSKTLPHPPSVVWDFISGDEGIAIWLGPGAELHQEKGAPYEAADGTSGEVRGYRPGDRIRLTHRAPGSTRDTTIQVAVSRARAEGKAVLRFHQERLSDATERAHRREHWKEVMAHVADALG
ncbi:ABATE domain-containing protein [Streptomyces sp. 71268]|uniref:ABATE domain-containing protein n=1 Tax=Streptomyces sp. 71268 TaxID=3002640 RepID=UPI0032B13F6F